MAPRLRIDTARTAKTTPPPMVKPRPHPATVVTGTYADDEIEFMTAVAEFKARTGRRFPTCSDFLNIAKSLGFARVSATNLYAEAR